jgi:hypothetical protein
VEAVAENDEEKTPAATSHHAISGGTPPGWFRRVGISGTKLEEQGIGLV